MDLYKRAVDAIHGNDAEGNLDLEWLEDAHREGLLAGWHMLALLIFYLGIPGGRAGTHEQERRIVNDWHKHMRDAIDKGELKALDPITLLRVRSPSEEADWVVDIDVADEFLRAQDMPVTFSDLIQHIRKQMGHQDSSLPPVPAGATRWTPEFTEEVRTFRASHSAKETAEHFGVSTARIREKLATKRSQGNAFNWRRS